jgi:hypothetical protein
MRRYTFSQGKVWIEDGHYRPIIKPSKPSTQTVVLLFVPFSAQPKPSTSDKETQPLPKTE